MRIKNIISSIIFICLSVAIFIVSSTFEIPAFVSGDHALGNDVFPKCVAIFMGILSIILLITSLMKKEESSSENQEAPIDKEILFKQYSLPLGGFIIMLIYVMLIESLGFIVDTCFLILAILSLFRCKNIWFYIGVTFVGSVGIYLLFTKVFLVILPVGIFAL